jgi:hypothetical protein
VITAAAVDAPGDVEVLQTRAWARSMREKKGSLPVAESEPGAPERSPVAAPAAATVGNKINRGIPEAKKEERMSRRCASSP